jgi:hypothetical protein
VSQKPIGGERSVSATPGEAIERLLLTPVTILLACCGGDPSLGIAETRLAVSERSASRRRGLSGLVQRLLLGAERPLVLRGCLRKLGDSGLRSVALRARALQSSLSSAAFRL